MALEVVPSSIDARAAAPMLAELAQDYHRRYGRNTELDRYPASEFGPPHGILLVLREDGHTVAGGAFRRYDDTTAEIKRMWTHSAHRRRGFARRMLGELERHAAAAGYRRIYLTTGSRQPEARALYLAADYTPLPEPPADPAGVRLLAFEKVLPQVSPGAPRR